MASEKITKLTPEQEARFPEFVKKWTDIGLSTQPAHREHAEWGVRRTYEIAGFAAPKIVWTGSPMGNALTRASVWDSVWDSVRASVRASVGASVWDSVRASVGASVGDSVRASVWASVGDSVWDSVRASVGASVWDSVRASVGASVGASVWDSVGDSVGDSVWDSVGDSVGDSVRASVGDSVGDSVRASGYGQHDANWISFYDFFAEVLGKKKETNKLEGLKAITESAGWFLPHKNICWISERHTLLKTDDRGRMHCESGPALQYPDGWGIFSWHGTRIPEQWIVSRASLTPEVALTTANVEQRRAACEILGWNNVLEHPSLNPKIIDADEPHIGTLIEVDLPDAPGQRFVKYRCGTGRWFAESVNDKSFNTALKANAAGNGWRGQGDPESFIPFFRS